MKTADPRTDRATVERDTWTVFDGRLVMDSQSGLPIGMAQSDEDAHQITAAHNHSLRALLAERETPCPACVECVSLVRDAITSGAYDLLVAALPNNRHRLGCPNVEAP